MNSKDDAIRNRVISQYAPLAVVQYDKGTDLKFPAPGAAPVIINSTCIKDWTSMPADRFPIVVRLEALTDEGRAQGRTFNSVEVGGELAPWLQSQTTYARMQRLDDGAWAPNNVTQKLWFNGQIFEVQEIYGLEQGRPAEGQVVEGHDEVEGNECVICMSEPRDTTALPCRHMCMCHTCANELKTQTNKCPICRNVFTELLHIKIPPIIRGQQDP